MSDRRRYRSPLRDEQTRQTRALILDALVELLNDVGPAELSIRDLATRANVSERTVYRHFPDRAALHEALVEHVGDRAQWVDVEDLVGDVHDLIEAIPDVYASFERFEADTRAIVLMNLDPARTAQLSRQHRVHFERVVTTSYPNLDESTVAETAAVLSLLGSSRTWLRFRDEAGLSAEQASRAAVRAVAAVLGDLDARAASSERTVG